MEKNIKSFTLIELVVVVIILGILAAVAIPIYKNAVEQRKGEVCINNIRTILAAWRIYNMRSGVWNPSPFQTTSQINTKLNIFMDERNFGKQSVNNTGFNMEADTTSHLLKIRAYRLSGSHYNKCIACYYDYNAGIFNWNPGVSPWTSTWPWLPTE